MLFDKDEGDPVGRRLAGAQLVAAHLVSFEIANVCVKICQRGLLMQLSFRLEQNRNKSPLVVDGKSSVLKRCGYTQLEARTECHVDKLATTVVKAGFLLEQLLIDALSTPTSRDIGLPSAIGYFAEVEVNG